MRSFRRASVINTRLKSRPQGFCYQPVIHKTDLLSRYMADEI